MDEEPSRKLAVILHADVVGSTVLVQADETLAHQRIQDAFRRLSEVVVSQGGTPREIRGDALVAEFSRASDAVEASLSFQADNFAYLKGLCNDIKPVIRIGIAMGEVVIADDTVTGEAVVLAQRLEQLAEHGGVCVQGTVQDTVPKRLPYAYQRLDKQVLKGFSEPVRAYRVRRAVDMVVSKHDTDSKLELVSLELPEEPSIAVLPLANMSGDPEQEYFSDGITEDIITALSRVSGLLVIARNSTMVYKGRTVDAKLVGQEQGVRYVLEGSVRKAGNRVRVTAQLIDAIGGHQIWADRYDRDLDDIFAVQDEITRNITLEMRVRLAEGEQARLWAGGTDSVQAWEFVSRALEPLHQHVKEDNWQARRLAEQAIAVDRRYANAWVMRGWTHWGDALWGWSESRQESLETAYESVVQSLELEEANPDAFALLGAIHMNRGEHDQSVEMADKAVSLAPNHSWILALSAMVRNSAGKPQEAVVRMQRAFRLSPKYPAWYLVILGNSYRQADQLDLAAKTLGEAVARQPDSAMPRVWFALALYESGSIKDAKSVAKEVVRIDPGFSVGKWAEGITYKDPTLREQMIADLCKIGLPR